MLEEIKNIKERSIKSLESNIVIDNFDKYLSYKENLNNLVETIKSQKNYINI